MARSTLCIGRAVGLPIIDGINALIRSLGCSAAGAETGVGEIELGCREAWLAGNKDLEDRITCHEPVHLRKHKRREA